MGIKKNILVDGMEVPFKASAAIPRWAGYLSGLCYFAEGSKRK